MRIVWRALAMTRAVGAKTALSVSVVAHRAGNMASLRKFIRVRFDDQSRLWPCSSSHLRDILIVSEAPRNYKVYVSYTSYSEPRCDSAC